MSSFRKRTKVKVLQTASNTASKNGYSDDEELHDKQTSNSNGSQQRQRLVKTKDTALADRSGSEISLQDKADAGGNDGGDDDNDDNNDNDNDDDDDDWTTTPGTSSTITAPLQFRKKKKKTKMKVRQGNSGTSVGKLGYNDSEDDENDGGSSQDTTMFSKVTARKSNTSKANASDSGGALQDQAVNVGKPKESQRKKKVIRPLFADFQDDENDEEDRGGSVENYGSSIRHGFGTDSTRLSVAQQKSRVKSQSIRQSKKATKQSDDLSYSPKNLKIMISAQKKSVWSNVENADANGGNDEAQHYGNSGDDDVKMSTDPPSPPAYSNTGNIGLPESGGGAILAERAVTKIYDDKTIEQIKAKKLKLRSELVAKAEREAVINNGRVTETYTTTETTTGSASGAAADKSSVDDDKIEIDEDFMNHSSDSDLEPEVVQQSATKTNNSNLTNNQQPSIRSIEKNVINLSGGATGEDLEETEFSDKRLAFDPSKAEKIQNEEIKDTIYDYNLEQDISDEDEELAKWENQKIYDALNTGVLAGDFDGAGAGNINQKTAEENDNGVNFDGGSGTGVGTGNSTGYENDNGTNSKTTAHDIKQYLKEMQQEKFIDDSFKRFPKLNKVFETIMRELEKPNVGIHIKKSVQEEKNYVDENEKEGSATPTQVDLFEVYSNKAKAFSKELETIASKKAEQVQLLKEEEISAKSQKEKIEQRILDMEKEFEGLDF